MQSVPAQQSAALSELGLASFVLRVNARAQATVQDERLHPDQRRLLLESLQFIERYSDPANPAQPLGLLYLSLRAAGREPDEQAVWVATFCLFYLCSADLLDDMQDDDLAGKPHASAGPAIASNSAVALLFLGLDALRRATELEPDPEFRQRYWETFNRISLIAAGAQHADLLGEKGAQTTADVLDMHRGKTSSMALFLECGALLGRLDLTQTGIYREIGLDLASLVQIVDDLRDIFGKEHSPDLAQRRVTYPLACFKEICNSVQAQELEELLCQAPIRLGAVRELLHRVEAVDRCAHDLEALRTKIHLGVASLASPRAEHRLILGIADTVAATIYECEPVPETRELWEPRGAFAQRLTSAAQAFSERLQTHSGLNLPPFEPWHQPFYMYEPERRVIYYPDVDGLPHEVLPFHARLWQCSLEEAAGLMHELAPGLIAHELVHAFRDELGLLTEDSWHEEYVANRLAVGFGQAQWPAELERVATLAARVVTTNTGRLEPEVLALLAASPQQVATEAGYGVSMETAALMHWQMVHDLIAVRPQFHADLEVYLSGETARLSAAE